MNPNTFHALAFLSGSCPDDQGRFVNEYLEFSPERWEECHNHIQWAFPSSIPSEFNPNAPIINYEVFREALFNGFSEFTGPEAESVFITLMELTKLYFNSIGITISRDGTANFDLDAQWLHEPDHNHRRLTRVMMLWYNFDSLLYNDIFDEFREFYNDAINQIIHWSEVKAADAVDDNYWENVRNFWYNAHRYGV